MSEASFHERFAAYLARRIEESTRPRAVLRRSLAFPPGTWPESFPYVEPFVATADKWTREAAYLVAGLYAASGVSAGSGNMGAAAFRLRVRTESDSVEARFLALLDADEEQLPHRLRQMVTLMSGQDIAPDWAMLFRDLTRWNDPRRRVQENWAREYYRHESADAADDESQAIEVGTRTEQRPNETPVGI